MRDFKGNLFTQKVARIWDGLPEKAVEADLITTLKIQLKRYMNWKGLEGNGPNAGKCDWSSVVTWSALSIWAEGHVSMLYGKGYDSI